MVEKEKNTKIGKDEVQIYRNNAEASVKTDLLLGCNKKKKKKKKETKEV